MVTKVQSNLVINGAFALALAILAALGWLNYRQINQMEEFQRWEHHTYTVSREFAQLLSALREVQTGVLGFVIAGRDEYLEPYRRAQGRINPTLARLRELARIDPRHADPMGEIEPLTRELLYYAVQSVELRRTSGFEAAAGLVSTKRDMELMEGIRVRITAALDQEERLLARIRARELECIREARLALFGGSTLSVALLVMVFMLLRREIAARTKAEKELRRHRDHLEELVTERTGELERAKREAEAASLAKSEFLANMSHEMRTPLAGVMAVFDLMLTDELAEPHRRSMEMARTSAEGLNRLINNILDYSMFSTGAMKVERRPFDLRRSLRSVIAPYAALAEGKGLRLLLEIDELAPSRVVGDEWRLRQVLEQLLDNAVKFTREGEVTLSVRPESDPGPVDGDFLTFTVRDTGPGIPAESMDRMFDMFTQADSSSRKSYSGLGLGLALTREMVERLGGTIRGESRPGQGSVFTFSLPLPAEEGVGGN